MPQTPLDIAIQKALKTQPQTAPRLIALTAGRKGQGTPLEAKESHWERAFDTRWQQLAPDLPAPEKEFRFCEERGFRFDRYFPAARLGVELHGEGHNKRKNFSSDLIKMRMAVEKNYRVLCYSGQELDNDPASVVAQIRRVLEGEESD